MKYAKVLYPFGLFVVSVLSFYGIWAFVDWRWSLHIPLHPETSFWQIIRVTTISLAQMSTTWLMYRESNRRLMKLRSEQKELRLGEKEVPVILFTRQFRRSISGTCIQINARMLGPLTVKALEEIEAVITDIKKQKEREQ
jgi:hypothetical protein